MCFIALLAASQGFRGGDVIRGRRCCVKAELPATLYGDAAKARIWRLKRLLGMLC